MRITDFGSPVLRAWCQSCDEQWQAYTHHAFVQGLGDGSLPRAAFMHYLVQDYLFLVHFARAWALLVVKADTVEEMRIASATVSALVNDEMNLHVQTCAAAGISEHQLFSAVEETETIAYTRYVLDAGLSGDFLDMLACLSPCVFGYGHIGLRLVEISAKSNPYQAWIDMYAGGEYQQVCRTVAGLIESASARRLPAFDGGYVEAAKNSPRWSTLTRRFDTATRLEVGFWEMGLRAGQ